MKSTFRNFFELQKRGSSISKEFQGALATFLTMSYILVVNPAILSGAGMPLSGTLTATALSAALCCIMMGLFSNFPLALASGMGINSFVAYKLVPTLGSWQAAMTVVFLNGVLIFVLVLFGLRKAVLTSIPVSIRTAISVGIGLFITLVGLINARLIVVPSSTLAILKDFPTATVPPVTFGPIKSNEAIIAIVGFLTSAFFVARKIKGGLLLGILCATGVSYLLGVSQVQSNLYNLDFSTFFKLDFSVLAHKEIIPSLLALMMVDFFDTLGTVTAISTQAGLSSGGKIPHLKRILSVDAMAASIGGLFGASSVTSYIESAAGVSEGARTGLHSVFVGLFFLLSLFFIPWISLIPPVATSGALILVGWLMFKEITEINWKEMPTALSCFIIIVGIPLTFSISHGIGLGLITFVLLKIFTGNSKDISRLLFITSLFFLIYFLIE